MQLEIKQKIATLAQAYAKEKGLSQSEVARQAKVNAGYVSQIFRGVFTNTVNEKETPIGDTHFNRLASWAGIALERQYWKLQPTVQFQEMITILENAKQKPQAAMIINSTGMGKTQAVDVFVKRHPQHTYRLTVGDSYKVGDIVNELIEMLGVDATPMVSHTTISFHTRLRKISARLEEIRNSGGNPIIILDEAENLRVPALKTIKEIYDASIEHSSLILIGTTELLETIQGTRNWRKKSMPQVLRRFKAGIRHISPLSKPRDFTPFFEQHSICPGLRQLLNGLADNYGELHDYLEPALREAAELGRELTEDLFRLKYNIPAPRKAA